MSDDSGDEGPEGSTGIAQPAPNQRPNNERRLSRPTPRRCELCTGDRSSGTCIHELFGNVGTVVRERRWSFPGMTDTPLDVPGRGWIKPEWDFVTRVVCSGSSKFDHRRFSAIDNPLEEDRPGPSLAEDDERTVAAQDDQDALEQNAQQIPRIREEEQADDEDLYGNSDEENNCDNQPSSSNNTYHINMVREIIYDNDPVAYCGGNKFSTCFPSAYNGSNASGPAAFA